MGADRGGRRSRRRDLPRLPDTAQAAGGPGREGTGHPTVRARAAAVALTQKVVAGGSAFPPRWYWPRSSPATRRSRPRSVKRPTGAAVGRNAGENGAKSGKIRTSDASPETRKSPANQCGLRNKRARLKIVVSPVRVRVSPSTTGLQTAVLQEMLADVRSAETLPWAVRPAIGSEHLVPELFAPEPPAVRRAT